MTPFFLCVETVPSISLGISVFSLSLSKYIPRTRWEEWWAVQYMVGGRHAAQTPQPTTPQKARHHWLVQRIRVCGLTVLGTLYLCGHCLLLSSAQEAQSLKEGMRPASAWLVENGGIRTALESYNADSAPQAPIPTMFTCPRPFVPILSWQGGEECSRWGERLSQGREAAWVHWQLNIFITNLNSNCKRM